MVYNRARPYTRDLWRQIQIEVNVPAGDIDGIPGPQTTERIAVWQAVMDMTPDGMAGPVTIDRMGVGPLRLVAGAVCWAGPHAIDADGAPNAYNGPDTGIDHLANAGPADDPWGYATDANGKPFVQGPGDPCPNHYVSTTALVDGRYAEHDPRRYVDARDIAYIALPRNMRELVPASMLPRKGDLCVCWREGAEAAAYRPGICADVKGGVKLDPGHSFGEGSIRMAQDLGHDPYRLVRGIWRASNGIGGYGVGFLVLPNTASDRLSNTAQGIAGRVVEALSRWGGSLDAAVQAIEKVRRSAQ